MAVKDTETKPSQEKEIKKPKETGKPLKVQEKPVSYCVYIGPSIRGVIQSGTVYQGTRKQVEKKLVRAIERFPLISKLIVTDRTFVQDRKKVKEPGNLLNRYFRKLAGNLN